MAALSLSTVDPCRPQPEAPRPSGAEQEGPKLKQEPFVGGPRPTLTKLQVIEFHSLSFALALLFYSPRSSFPNSSRSRKEITHAAHKRFSLPLH